MYESYWQLTAKPFNQAADANFYYPSETHQGALLKLRYAVEGRLGCAALAGGSGAGKTFVVHALRRQLGDAVQPFVHLVYPLMSPSELLAYVADELGAEQAPSPSGVHDNVRRIQRVLAEAAAKQRHAVVVIDEAHLLEDTGALEAVRLLLNFESEMQRAMTIILSGQPAMLPALDRMPQLEERLAVKSLLRPLTQEETAAYVNHRLRAAGAEREIFRPDAYEALHQLTHGSPRRINRLCELALLVGFAEERQSLGADELAAVSHELLTVAPE